MGKTTIISDFSNLSREERHDLMKRLRQATYEAMTNGLTTAAFELARIGTTLNPNEMWFLYQYGECLRLTGRVVEAEAVLLDVHSRKEYNRHLTEISLGSLYRDTGRLEIAERWFRQATATAPGDTGPWIFLAVFLSRLGRFPEAIDVLERAMKAEGDLDEVWLNMGLTRRALGDYQAARECVERAIDLSPDYDAAIRVLRDIQQAIFTQGLHDVRICDWTSTTLLAGENGEDGGE